MALAPNVGCPSLGIGALKSILQKISWGCDLTFSACNFIFSSNFSGIKETRKVIGELPEWVTKSLTFNQIRLDFELFYEFQFSNTEVEVLDIGLVLSHVVFQKKCIYTFWISIKSVFIKIHFIFKTAISCCRIYTFFETSWFAAVTSHLAWWQLTIVYYLVLLPLIPHSRKSYMRSYKIKDINIICFNSFLENLIIDIKETLKRYMKTTYGNQLPHKLYLEVRNVSGRR